VKRRIRFSARFSLALAAAAEPVFAHSGSGGARFLRRPIFAPTMKVFGDQAP
jgi:hypothetical protein